MRRASSVGLGRCVRAPVKGRLVTLSKIWVFAEADGDKPSSSTLELLTKAREVGDAARQAARALGATPLVDQLRAVGSAPARQEAGTDVLTMSMMRGFIGLAVMFVWLRLARRPAPLTPR